MAGEMDSGNSKFSDLQACIPLKCPPTGFAKECEMEAVDIDLPGPDPTLLTHSLLPVPAGPGLGLELAETPEGIEVVNTSHRGEIGEGVVSVFIHAEGRAYTFGPVNLRTEEEVPLLKALLKDEYYAKKSRDAEWPVGSAICS